MIRNVARLRRACYTGYFIQAVINNLLPLFFVLISTNYDITLTELGGLIFFNFIFQLGIDIASIKLIGIIGTKRAVVIAQILSAVGVVGLAFLPYILPSPYVGFIICIAVYATGSGFIEVIISPIIEKIPSNNKSGSMSLLHSFYCWGQAGTVLITTLLIKLAGASWRLVPLFWMILPIFNTVAFIKSDVPEIDGDHGTKSGISLKNTDYILFLVLMLCAGASELAMSQWASAFSESVLGISKVTGDIVGPCLFAVFMGSGRVLYGLFSKRINGFTAIIGCAILCVLCYITAAFSPVPALSLIACAVCGFSVSIMWPGITSIAAGRFPNGGSLLFATIAMAGDLGCSLGPWVLGTVADFVSFSAGFVATSVFPFIMVIAAFILKRKFRINSEV